MLKSNITQGLFCFYRVAISPLLGRRCRFFPSCSVYAKQAFLQHSVLKALWLSTKRLSACHPFHPGGIDEVPQGNSTRGMQTRPRKNYREGQVKTKADPQMPLRLQHRTSKHNEMSDSA